MFDVLIRGGKVVDGKGSPWYHADVGIKDGVIVAVAPNLPTCARTVVTATDRLVCPGFIDIHSHADIPILRSPARVPKVTQGVTTEVFSNCGLGVAPVNEYGRKALLEYTSADYEGISFDWLSVSEYLSRIPRCGVNVAYLIPHGAIRASVMGFEARPARPTEIDSMCALVREGMLDGAFGLSTGLSYVPMSSSEPGELASLCTVVSGFGGFLACHLKDYNAGLDSSLADMESLALDSGIPVQVSHYAVSGKVHCHDGKEMARYIDRLRASGVDITFDSYPYEYGAGWLRNTIPGRYHSDGISGLIGHLSNPQTRIALKKEISEYDTYDLTKLVIMSVADPGLRYLVGKSLPEGARQQGKDLFDFLFDILGRDPSIAHANFTGDTEIMRELARSPYQMVGSDSIEAIPGQGFSHPRFYGAFTRFLKCYAREDAVLTWEQAIWKMTGLPAWRLGLNRRGTIAPGYHADVVVLNPSTVSDRATLTSPEVLSTGVDWVFVNGVAELANGHVTGELGGTVMRKGDV